MENVKSGLTQNAQQLNEHLPERRKVSGLAESCLYCILKNNKEKYWGIEPRDVVRQWWQWLGMWCLHMWACIGMGKYCNRYSFGRTRILMKAFFEIVWMFRWLTSITLPQLISSWRRYFVNGSKLLLISEAPRAVEKQPADQNSKLGSQLHEESHGRMCALQGQWKLAHNKRCKSKTPLFQWCCNLRWIGLLNCRGR